MKIKKYQFVSILSLLMLFLLAFSSAFLFNPSNSKTFAETTQSNSNFYLTVYDRSENVLLTNNETTFFGKKAYVYKWQDTSKFVFNIDTTKRVPNKNFILGVETYNLTIEIQYMQAYHEKASWTNYSSLLLYSNIQTGAKSYQNFNLLKPEFNIDEGFTGKDLTTDLTKTVSSWGIYRFRMVINGQDTYSDFFIIEPTHEVFSAPKITYSVEPSKVTLHNAYKFSLKNANEYKYVDASNLVWYAFGKAKDGATYSLTFSDLQLRRDEFKDCSNALYETYERTGHTFYFDDKGVAGDWKIWCEYNFDGSEQSTLVSNMKNIRTGNQLSKTAVTWIIVGVSAFFTLITIGICIYKIKREKVY